ncbi:hypothetical protein BDQ12DRAFT_292334 [Crucibulum laeve]|uniref:Uncharacterized protein n=1 Tax=Crucibulum laeve TaxID=68775 RepID=A0A5C3MC54_9AGAR|nr:hypothetical protein BDQ12DRAFT_292334 [Crucibulum laeve]
MRPSITRLVRIIPRSALKIDQARVFPAPAPQPLEMFKPTVIDLLLRQKEESLNWPANIRIEPVVKKKIFARVDASLRTRMKRLLKET